MKRTKVCDRSLPGYTQKEETLNCLTHALGAVFAVIALILCLVFAKDTPARISGAVYCLSMLALFVTSATYHGLKKEYTKKIWQVIDHCIIYLMIVGSYMPMLVTGLYPYNRKYFFIVLAALLVFAGVGAAFTAIDVNKYKPVTMATYLIIGWCFVLLIKMLRSVFPTALLWWILAGGIAITCGTVLYLFGHKRRYFHSVFHVAVDAGAILMFIGIFKYCIT